jgi:hypothetical protein
LFSWFRLLAASDIRTVALPTALPLTLCASDDVWVCVRVYVLCKSREWVVVCVRDGTGACMCESIFMFKTRRMCVCVRVCERESLLLLGIPCVCVCVLGSYLVSPIDTGYAYFASHTFQLSTAKCRLVELATSPVTDHKVSRLTHVESSETERNRAKPSDTERHRAKPLSMSIARNRVKPKPSETE